MSPLNTSEGGSPESGLQRYSTIRSATEALAAPLTPEDCSIQSMPDVSPTRWHLAHTTWFFETFVLEQVVTGYRRFNPAFHYLFNSYYNSVGEQFPRDRRGLLSRPTLGEVFDYRRYVDEAMHRLLRPGGPSLAAVIELGLQHEQQHQELILTDIKHVLSCNPLAPVYAALPEPERADPAPFQWKSFPEGIYCVGHAGQGFAFDNESPRHRVFLGEFQIASRPVTNGEYLAFMEAGGYKDPALWLSAAWQQVRSTGWEAPLYWAHSEGLWRQFTLSGLQDLHPADPVSHVSYFEADAYARWAGARLPGEFEWEVAAAGLAHEGNFAESRLYRPAAPSWAPASGQLSQMFGDVWEWTASSYAPYPGYKPVAGALGEYNGKFMCSQYVLRGGSCATPSSHIRATYRNFFSPETRWQFTGIRLCR